MQNQRRSPACHGRRAQQHERQAARPQRLRSRRTRVAYIAHAPLEPRAAVAEWKDGKLTVWTGTQRPFGVRSELASAFRIAEDRVRVIVPDTGSGYGGKHTGEAAIEAARLAKAAGKPVKLVWTREEEFTWAYFRPAGVIEITSGVKHDGTITAWEFHNYNSGASAIRSPYAIPHQRTQFHPSQLAAAAGLVSRPGGDRQSLRPRSPHGRTGAAPCSMDPLAFRLQNLQDARLRAVLEAAADSLRLGQDESRAGPRLRHRRRHGEGRLCGDLRRSRGAIGRAAQVQLVRVVTAFECGAIVNPDGLKNQVEGAVMHGPWRRACSKPIEFADGKILNPRFSRYRVPRFSDVPPLETVLLDRKDLPSAGAGECPIVALAPAVGNAIFDATGVRLRSLPLHLHGTQT